MSLIGALNIGGAALATSSAELQVTGNNVANAGNANYSEEVAGVTSTPDQNLGAGIYVGTGVDLSGVSRQVDEALQSRLANAVSDYQAANTTSQWSGQIESVFNALGTNSLDTTLGTFYNSWSSLANNPTDPSLRQVVVQSGQAVASQFNSLSSNLGTLQTNIGSQLSSLVTSANQIAGQIATLNQQISVSQGNDNSLLDQRDAAVQQLSQLVSVQTVQQGNGTENVYIGSEPLVMGTVSRGLALQQQSDGTQGLVFQADNGTVPPTTGQIGALVAAQTQVNSTISQLDTLSQGVVSGLNSVYASGQGINGFTSVTGTNQVLNPTVALNNPQAGLAYPPTNGSFVVHVTNTATNLSTSTLVQVNLTGSPGDTTLNSLTASLNAIPGVAATINGGKLSLNASPNMQISFSQDTSNTLSALGINTFFQGSTAGTMQVNQQVVTDPNSIAAAKNGTSGDNQTALAIATLGDASQSVLSGQSVNQAYTALIGGVATTTATANSNAQATQEIQNTLTAQRQSLSGVSIDNEAINMMQQQRAFQGASRLITTVDAMMTALFAII